MKVKLGHEEIFKGEACTCRLPTPRRTKWAFHFALKSCVTCFRLGASMSGNAQPRASVPLACLTSMTSLILYSVKMSAFPFKSLYTSWRCLYPPENQPTKRTDLRSSCHSSETAQMAIQIQRIIIVVALAVVLGSCVRWLQLNVRPSDC